MPALTAKSTPARRPRAGPIASKPLADEASIQEISFAASVSSRDARNRFGQLLDKARQAPVAITKQNQPVAVILSVQEYENLLQRLDDAYWADRADKAFAQGDWPGVEQSEKFLREILNAPD